MQPKPLTSFFQVCRCLTDALKRVAALYVSTRASVKHCVAACFIVLTAGLFRPVPLGAQQAAPEFKGPDGCIGCHTIPTTLRFRDLSLLDESEIWSKQDKHSKAYELLKGPLGKKIALALKIEDMSKAKQCLSCHTNWHADSKDPPPFHDLGVTCESCHGPSSNWLTPHYEAGWRGKTPEEKQKLGMIDVREPLARARQCFSCHIGNSNQGKVVTHEMYAAGHPPLPSIELESFAEQMPPHWRNLRERGAFVDRDKFLAANFPGVAHDPLADLPRTKGVIVGGILAMQASVQLFRERVSKEEGPELAVFDCGACHHDLRSPSWRQERGYHGVAPGRPTIPAWPAALVRLGLRHEAGTDTARFDEQTAAFQARLKALREAVAARPFGDAEKTRAAANELDKLLEALAVKISKSAFDEAAAQRALAALYDLPDNEFPDFHSARQIAWAIKTIHVELKTAYPTFEPPPQEITDRPVRRAWEDKNAAAFAAWRDGPRAETQKSLNQLYDKLELNDKLFLNLPAGQKYKVEVALPDSLQRMADYDARWFRKQLAELRKGP